jgi:hypothetical protein
VSTPEPLEPVEPWPPYKSFFNEPFPEPFAKPMYRWQAWARVLLLRGPVLAPLVLAIYAGGLAHTISLFLDARVRCLRGLGHDDQT